MYIGNLPADTACTLFVRNAQGQSVRLESTVLEQINDFSIKLEACFHDGKLINMSGFQCTLEAVAEDRFLTFELGNIMLQRENPPFYLATCTTHSISKNRRGAVRVPLSGKVIVRIGERVLTDCFACDLSCTGIAVAVPKSERVDVGENISVAFKHNWDETMYQVKGRVARFDLTENGRYNRIGVEFTGVYKEIDKLVAEIQRDRVAAHKRELMRKKL